MTKLREFFKKLVERFKGLFKTTSTEVATPTPTIDVNPPKPTPFPHTKPFSGTPRPVVLSDFAGRSSVDLMLFMGRGFMGLEENLARAAGVVFRDPPVYESVDKSGFVFSGDQDVKVNPVHADVPYTFTVPVSKSKQKLAVFGAPGAFFTQAACTIQGVTASQSAASLGTEFDFSVPAGTYQVVISVNGSGSLAVQFNEW